MISFFRTFDNFCSQTYKNILPKKINKINPFSANFTKWSNTIKQFVGSFPTICLSVFDHFSGLALKELKGK